MAQLSTVTMSRIVVVLMVVGALVMPGSARAVPIGNGLTGDGFWSVNVFDGGVTALDGYLDPAGDEGPVPIIYEYFLYVDVGADGGAISLDLTNITVPATITGDGEVTSEGWFDGEQGPIRWKAVSTIAPGSPVYLTKLFFESDFPFGNVRLIQYLDEDVPLGGHMDDRLIVVGDGGTPGFQLLTVDNNTNIGIAQAAAYGSADNMTYAGWAAEAYPDLQYLIRGEGALYAPEGIVNSATLPPIAGGDPRYPGLPAFGPADITTGIAFDFDPTARSASVTVALGGSAEGDPVPVDPVPVIDIKPGNPRNTVNPCSEGSIPVAVFGSPERDVTTIILGSARLSGASVRTAGRSGNTGCHVKDVDGDELPDLLCHFDTAQLDLSPGEGIAVFTALTMSGESVTGEDSIRLVRDPRECPGAHSRR